MLLNKVKNISKKNLQSTLNFLILLNINIYPNPFSSTTTFEINSTSTFKLRYTFELYNIIGKKVKKISNITSNKFVISRDNLPEGIYIYKINSKNGLFGVGKIVAN
ncbi:MAG: T9SS type A sorting domain-containing protein [Bacteroidetes bacterium]|nr:T9SS type A sorting domain-containing protein [Bacteroidota bacterium]